LRTHEKKSKSKTRVGEKEKKGKKGGLPSLEEKGETFSKIPHVGQKASYAE